MKTKMIPYVSIAMILSLTTASIAYAEENIAVNANSNTKVQVEDRGNSTSTNTRSNENENNKSTSTEAVEATSTDRTERNDSGQLTAEEHRSVVASFVQSLLNVADREGGIGNQVRAVAKSQNDSASTSAEAIIKVSNRSGFKTFLVGTDYSSLGQLRSEMIVTQNNIDQLKNLMLQATSDTDKAQLAAQIKVLEDSQAKLNLFVSTHENTFSLFGWLSKMFTQ